MNATQTNQENSAICPFLGMPFDWQTAMDYPSRQNFCRKMKPPIAPEDSYQREYCLAQAYTQCPRFSSDVTPSQSPLQPSSIEKSAKRGTVPGWIIPVLIILIIASLIVWLILSRLLPAINTLTVKPPVETAGQLRAPLPPPTLAPIITKTLSELSPSGQTNTPTASIEPIEIVQPTSAPPHVLEEPFGTIFPLLLHRVVSGEDLISIANTFHSSVDAIRNVNFNMPAELWSDTIIIIPVNQADINGILPMKAFEVTTDGLTLETLAKEQGIDPASLALYNDRSSGYLFQKGEWVVLPQTLPVP